jgi:DNA-repair protein XRCC1
VNLLSCDNKTWKCKNPGEKQASVVLQLEREVVLTSIDVGNENSAFIEVLVGRSSTPDSDFEVLEVHYKWAFKEQSTVITIII